MDGVLPGLPALGVAVIYDPEDRPAGRRQEGRGRK